MTRGSKKWINELPRKAEITRNKRIRYLPFLNEGILMTGRVWDIIESKMSIIVPRGQINPQKNLPKTSVPIIKKIDNRAAAITARYAILVIIRINGSNRKKMF